jgi:hypothetical protein
MARNWRLATCLRQKYSEIRSGAIFEVTPLDSRTYPLTFPQQAILLDALLHGQTTKFNMGGGIVIPGPLDSALFRRGLEFAFRRHDVQRMRILVEGGEARQEYVEEGESPFEVLDFSGRSEPLRCA